MKNWRLFGQYLAIFPKLSRNISLYKYTFTLLLTLSRPIVSDVLTDELPSGTSSAQRVCKVLCIVGLNNDYLVPLMTYSTSYIGVTLKCGLESRSKSLKIARIDRSYGFVYSTDSV